MFTLMSGKEVQYNLPDLPLGTQKEWALTASLLDASSLESKKKKIDKQNNSPLGG